MRRIDAFAIRTVGIPGVVLMENAGHAVFEQAYKGLAGNGKPAVILCGRGNNGGDGFVVARRLINNGVETSVHVVGAISKIKGDAGVNLRILRRMGVSIQRVTKKSLPELRSRLKSSGLIVDALLGTGLSGEVSGLFHEVISLINGAGSPVVAVDIPSGLDGVAGAPLGIAVVANATVTFQLPKKAFENPLARNYTGRLTIADIGIPVHLFDAQSGGEKVSGG
jgi:NAD(P)H-hydrate epimerase